MAVTLTEKGQITIPLALRKRIGLKPGMRLVFDETAPYLKATREVDIAEMRSAIGCLRTDGTPQAQQLSSGVLLERMRGPAEG